MVDLFSDIFDGLGQMVSEDSCRSGSKSVVFFIKCKVYFDTVHPIGTLERMTKIIMFYRGDFGEYFIIVDSWLYYGTNLVKEGSVLLKVCERGIMSFIKGGIDRGGSSKFFFVQKNLDTWFSKSKILILNYNHIAVTAGINMKLFSDGD